MDGPREPGLAGRPVTPRSGPVPAHAGDVGTAPIWITRTLAGAAALLLAAQSAASAGTSWSPAGAATSGGVVSFAPVTIVVPAQNDSAPFDQRRTLVLPTGWTVEVWARVPGARFALWTPQGELLVSVPGAGEVVELQAGASRAAVPRRTVLLSGLSEPQGMAFDTLDGRRVLYVAESNEIDRYAWNPDGAVGARTVVVAGLADTDPRGDDVHRLKEIVVGPHHAIYVDIGSSSNVDTTDNGAKPPRAVVMVYGPDGQGRVYARGVRNGDGLSIDPDGELWTAVNERDSIPYPFHRAYGGDDVDAFGQLITAYVNDHPPDELAKLTPGRDLGWPWCNPDPDVTPGEATSALRYANLPFDADAGTNPNGSSFDCATLKPIERGLPAHSAPLGFHFLEGTRLPAPWSKGAVVAIHGSWDRTPPRAPAVLWFPWEAGQRTLGNQVDLVTGFQNADGARWGRPVDAVAGPDGALYVTDDTAGAVYRIALPSTTGR
jgi:glucose/arabinose dehydrogenase